ncbi:oxidoreductase domain protein [Beutenbergia cavernae DSM 12333]|uniref:Oxidoreductase domain protein n=1 Tax=Beutenbergia cavernae (strain ATCC BAA-8 / DSM 12333 / CCUG 43141 / JCM 11478 / NBRC 16432 / NCIMB 13614 / HKI 0122) TaxID=471853 RepID=C5C665_BEUC1|nr:Gfo/Idh/MocA family oxidoreductase [Beutenbergia cavernae]ACQ82423.1 oxidoreductase domain protein [Beutenbergia cavernae DSM 12333]
MARDMRVAVIGCGKIGATHAEAASALPGVELVAVCDRTVERAKELAERFPGVRVYDAVDRMLADADLDAVLVATAHKHHFSPAMQAIHSGVAALVEKPLTTSLAEANELVVAAERAGVTLGTVFQRRFFPAAQRMHDAIAAGRLGGVVAAECLAQLGRDRTYFERDDWRGSWTGEGGGALLTMAIHYVDMMNWMLGTPTSVYGRWATLKHADYIDVEDVAGAVVTYAGGAIATIQAMTTFENGFASEPSPAVAYRAPGFRLAVHGTAGHSVGLQESPELAQAVTDLWTFDGEEELARRWHEEEHGRPSLPGFHRIQIAEFLDAVRAGRPPAITGRDGLTALEVVKGVYLSQDRLAPVSLPMSDDDRRDADRLTEGAA